jgi:hypothetical protein
MKNLSLSLLIIGLTFISCKKEEAQKPETTTTKEEVVSETKPDSAAVAKAWMDYATPSKAHEMLAKDNGTWDAELTFWSPDNPQEMKSTATVTYKMIMGGKYQEGTYSGDKNNYMVTMIHFFGNEIQLFLLYKRKTNFRQKPSQN